MNENLPPPNRAIGWYRFMLWLMPAFVVAGTAVGLSWLGSVMPWQWDFLPLFWFFLNLATTAGIGFFESQLRRPPSPKPANSAAKFTALQILVVPVVLIAVVHVLDLLDAP